MNLEQLIYEAKKGNRQAEDALFSHLYDRSYSLCLRYVKNEADAEERLMDGLCNFFKRLLHFNYESDEAVYACINRIMSNECIMQLRKTRVFNIVAEPLETDAILNEYALDRLSGEEIHAMIRKLPVGARTVLIMYAIEGYSHKYIANKLRIARSTSRAHLNNARMLLQRSLSTLNKEHEKQQSK